jgi:hypothetical protein
MARKQVLTLAQLSTYDDLLTDALIDRVRRKQAGGTPRHNWCKHGD